MRACYGVTTPTTACRTTTGPWRVSSRRCDGSGSAAYDVGVNAPVELAGLGLTRSPPAMRCLLRGLLTPGPRNASGTCYHLREEPGAGKPHARICEGEAGWPTYSTTARRWRTMQISRQGPLQQPLAAGANGVSRGFVTQPQARDRRPSRAARALRQRFLIRCEYAAVLRQKPGCRVPVMRAAQCSFCQHTNPPDAKFCNTCGGALDLAPCPHCGAVNDATASTCRQCSGSLHGRANGAASPSPGVRKSTAAGSAGAAGGPPNPIPPEPLSSEGPDKDARVSATLRQMREYLERSDAEPAVGLQRRPDQPVPQQTRGAGAGGSAAPDRTPSPPSPNPGYCKPSHGTHIAAARRRSRVARRWSSSPRPVTTSIAG